MIVLMELMKCAAVLVVDGDDDGREESEKRRCI